MVLDQYFSIMFSVVAVKVGWLTVLIEELEYTTVSIPRMLELAVSLKVRVYKSNVTNSFEL